MLGGAARNRALAQSAVHVRGVSLAPSTSSKARVPVVVTDGDAAYEAVGRAFADKERLAAENAALKAELMAHRATTVLSAVAHLGDD